MTSRGDRDVFVRFSRQKSITIGGVTYRSPLKFYLFLSTKLRQVKHQGDWDDEAAISFLERILSEKSGRYVKVTRRTFNRFKGVFYYILNTTYYYRYKD